MTTRLAGNATRFLPFDKGRDSGAGNPPDPVGRTYRTAYLWEEVLQRGSLTYVNEEQRSSVGMHRGLKAGYSRFRPDEDRVSRPCFTPFVLMRAFAIWFTAAALPLMSRTSRQFSWSRCTCSVERIESW